MRTTSGPWCIFISHTESTAIIYKDPDILTFSFTTKMDSIDLDKIQAIKKYKQTQKVNNLLFYCITTVIFTFLCSSPLWFPPLFISIQTLIFVSLPKIISFFLSAKSLFIVGNLIVIFLFGESKIYSSLPSLLRQPRPPSPKSSSSKASASSRQVEYKVQNVVTAAETKAVRAVRREKKLAKKVQVLVPQAMVNRRCEEVVIKGEEKVGSVDQVEEDGELGLSTEDLMKRADEFIAMFNKQIRLEAANAGSF